MRTGSYVLWAAIKLSHDRTTINIKPLMEEGGSLGSLQGLGLTVCQDASAIVNKVTIGKVTIGWLGGLVKCMGMANLQTLSLDLYILLMSIWLHNRRVFNVAAPQQTCFQCASSTTDVCSMCSLHNRHVFYGHINCFINSSYGWAGTFHIKSPDTVWVFFQNVKYPNTTKFHGKSKCLAFKTH